MKIGQQIILTWVGTLKMKTEREMFEAWCHIDDEFCTHRYTDNCQEYSDDYTQSAWLAWQASAQREGYKLVPVETLEESLDWASVAKWDSPNNARDEEINKHEEIIRALIGAKE